MINSDLLRIMRTEEPKFELWSDSDLQELIGAINECGYRFKVISGTPGFDHPDNGLYLKIPGLHLYDPDGIRETYKNVWSKDTFQKQEQKTLRVNGYKAFMSWLISFALLLWDSFDYSWYVIGFLFVRYIYKQILLRKHVKENGILRGL